MNAAAALLALLLHAGLVLAAAPSLAGLLDAGRARLAGRAAPPALQPWRDLARLLRKQPVVAEHASALTVAAPGLCLAANAAAALLVPSFTLGMASAPASDLLVIVGLLAFGRLVLALAALDAGTALGGVAASRSGALAACGEPALALVVLTVALVAGGTNLDRAVAFLREGTAGASASLALAASAMSLVLLVDAGRSASGVGGARSALDAAAGAEALELTGRHLALATLAGQVRSVAWLSLVAALFLRFGLAPEGAGPGAWAIGLIAWAAKVGVLAGAVLLAGAWLERRPPSRQAEILGVATATALLAAILLAASQGSA